MADTSSGSDSDDSDTPLAAGLYTRIVSRTREASYAVDALVERTKEFGTHARSELATLYTNT